MWWIDFFSSLLAYVVLNTEEQEFLKKGFANDIKILAGSVWKYIAQKSDMMSHVNLTRSSEAVCEQHLPMRMTRPSELNLHTVLSRRFFEFIA